MRFMFVSVLTFVLLLAACSSATLTDTKPLIRVTSLPEAQAVTVEDTRLELLSTDITILSEALRHKSVEYLEVGPMGAPARLGAAGAKVLSGMENLSSLYFHGVRIENGGVAELSRIPHLKYLYFHSCIFQSKDEVEVLLKSADLKKIWFVVSQPLSELTRSKFERHGIEVVYSE